MLLSRRELADLGVLGSLLDMLAAGNSSVTRRAGARALGRLGDDAMLLRRMGETGETTSQAQLLGPIPVLCLCISGVLYSARPRNNFYGEFMSTLHMLLLSCTCRLHPEAAPGSTRAGRLCAALSHAAAARAGTRR
jgi:hypothetical protein